MQVLLFHAERSTSYGKDSDQHSQAQAVTGIFARGTAFWIRGPSGVSKATWHRANALLESKPWVAAQQEVPRVLTRTPRQHASGASAATEYSIDWLLVAWAIAEFRHTDPEQMLLAEMPFEAEGVSHRDTGGLTVRQGGVSLWDTPPPVRVSHCETPTDLYRMDLTELSAQRRRSLLTAEVQRVKAAIERTLGRAVTAGHAHVPGQVTEIAHRVGVFGAALEEWIHSLMRAKNRAGYNVAQPGFFSSAASNDLIRWRNQPEYRNLCLAEQRAWHQAWHDANNPPPGQLVPIAQPAAAAQPLTPADMPALAKQKRFGGAR